MVRYRLPSAVSDGSTPDSTPPRRRSFGRLGASDVATQALMRMDRNVGRKGDIGLSTSLGGRMSLRARPAWKECRRGQRAACHDTAGRLHSARIDEQPRCLTLDLHGRVEQKRSCYLGDATLSHPRYTKRWHRREGATS